MTIMLDLSPDVENQVRKEAERQEIPVSDYIARVLMEMASVSEKAARQNKATQWDQLLEIGDEDEQKETFAYLKKAMEEDRLSERKRFKP